MALDGEIGYAATCIDTAVTAQCPRGTRPDATAAAKAMRCAFYRVVSGHLCRSHYCGYKEVGAHPGDDKTTIITYHAEAGACGPIPFHQRGAVDAYAPFATETRT